MKPIHLSLIDPSDFIRQALEPYTDPRFIAGCPPRWLPAIRETCAAAPQIVTDTLKEFYETGIRLSHWGSLQQCKAAQFEINQRLCGYFGDSCKRCGPQSDGLFRARIQRETVDYVSAMKKPLVVAIPCELCRHPVPVRRQKGTIVRCSHCGLELCVVTENRQWQLVFAGGVNALTPDLKDSYAVLGVPFGAPLTEVQDAFGSNFLAYHPQCYRDAPTRIQELAEMSMRVLTHAAKLIEASTQVAREGESIDPVIHDLTPRQRTSRGTLEQAGLRGCPLDR